MGFQDKVPLPKAEQKEFTLKPFFARFYACEPYKLTDAESKFSEAFIENFVNKMGEKGYFDVTKDYKFKCKGKLSDVDFEVDFLDNIENSCIRISKFHKLEEESKDLSPEEKQRQRLN